MSKTQHTVRAYMSGPPVTVAQQQWHYNVPAEVLAIDAWDEAARILADVEPQTRYSSTFACISYYRPVGSRGDRAQMHAALAESLAAFVNASVQA